MSARSEFQSVCWNVQPNDFKIELGGENVGQLSQQLADAGFPNIPKTQKGLHVTPSNAYFQFFSGGDTSEPIPITPMYPGTYVLHKEKLDKEKLDEEKPKLVLYVRGDRGLRPGLKFVKKPLLLFQKKTTNRNLTTEKRTSEGGKKDNPIFTDEEKYGDFVKIVKDKASYNGAKGNHTFPTQLGEETYWKDFNRENGWDKGIFLSVLNALGDSKKGICPDMVSPLETLKKESFFDQITKDDVHCVFFKVSVEKTEKKDKPVFKFVIDKEKTGTCKNADESPKETSDVKKRRATASERKVKEVADESSTPSSQSKKTSRKGQTKPLDQAIPAAASSNQREPSSEVTQSTEKSVIKEPKQIADDAAIELMKCLQSAYTRYCLEDNTVSKLCTTGNALGTLLEDNKNDAKFPTFEQRKEYTIEITGGDPDDIWNKITAYLGEHERKPEGIHALYTIVGDKKYYEETPLAANLRNILDSCISLWKYRTLNSPNPKSTSEPAKPSKRSSPGRQEYIDKQSGTPYVPTEKPMDVDDQDAPRRPKKATSKSQAKTGQLFIAR